VLCRQLSAMLDYNKVPQLVLNSFSRQHTFVLLEQRLVLSDQVIFLRLHLLHLKLGLQ
jgi:hypothetical protein